MHTKPLWCDDFRKTVQQSLDGEVLTLSTRRAISQHREACPPCCDFYDHLVQIAALSADLLPPREYEPPDDVELLNKIVNDVKDI